MGESEEELKSLLMKVKTQTLAFPTSKRGLDREAQAALLRIRTRSECAKGNLKELA